MRNCGAIQKMEIVLLDVKAMFLLLFSTIAAETMEKVTVKRPMPMRWRGDTPEVFPVSLRDKGMKKSS